MDAIVDAYRIGGCRKVIDEMWLRAVRRSWIGKIVSRVMGDVLHEKVVAAVKLGYWPHIRAPRSFNEKIIHRKVFTDEDIFRTVSDKYAVREYVNKRVGGEILNEIHCVTTNPENIPFEELPTKFVLKATHGSGMNKIVENKNNIDEKNIIAECERWLNTEFGSSQREYWYRDIKPRIIVEKYINDPDFKTPLDYKLFVFHGKVRFIEVDFDRFSFHKQRFFYPDWGPCPFEREYPQGPEIDMPKKLDKMIEIAEKLGESFEFARVDLYCPGGDEIIFGEITLAPQAGNGRFYPKQYDFEIGSYW